ncbi:hypothetical protein [Virgibacillus ihumii]|uniref:hypothetical protein n=1 Tax=Virgibacillus ihumii TaxID=2686091 RepID=UPI00157C33C4|nr:hypothetical protein [Virgibacillus ihumii]
MLLPSSGTSTVRAEHQPHEAKHQPYEWNINRASGTSTARGEHQPHGENINRMSGTSTARGEHQPYEVEHQPHEQKEQNTKAVHFKNAIMVVAPQWHRRFIIPFFMKTWLFQMKQLLPL